MASARRSLAMPWDHRRPGPFLKNQEAKKPQGFVRRVLRTVKGFQQIPLEAKSVYSFLDNIQINLHNRKRMSLPALGSALRLISLSRTSEHLEPGLPKHLGSVSAPDSGSKNVTSSAADTTGRWLNIVDKCQARPQAQESNRCRQMVGRMGLGKEVVVA
ncbi:hypothetical protein RRG08_013200 [Elysia crispata]|uniref:Uncharacterized protein n=1 Tax=Elysia crispata TaxID=231223 RepID=A0AAE1EAD4_9GAST|nr:hypothetical protein RRG08_013200 [Elysia crispata]